MARRPAIPTRASAVVERSRDGQREMLIAKLPHGIHEGRWTFPNDAVEVGESPETTVRRVLHHDLGMTAEVVYGQPPFDQPWDSIMTRWRFFFCEATDSAMNDQHFAETRWVPRPSLCEYEFDPVSQHVVDWLLEDRA